MLKRRVIRLRAEVRTDTLEMRNQAISSLQELFIIAKNQAQNTNIKSKERQDWMRIAAYTCQVMNSVAARLDDNQVDKDLNNLEELVNEIQAKGKTQNAPAKVL
jgi:hypothetical protein